MKIYFCTSGCRSALLWEDFFCTSPHSSSSVLPPHLDVKLCHCGKKGIKSAHLSLSLLFTQLTVPFVPLLFLFSPFSSQTVALQSNACHITVLRLLSTILTLLLQRSSFSTFFPNDFQSRSSAHILTHFSLYPDFPVTWQLASCHICNHIVWAIFKLCSSFCSVEAPSWEICPRIKPQYCQHIYSIRE